MQLNTLPTLATVSAVPSASTALELRSVVIGWRSRFLVWMFRLFLKPWLGWVMRGPVERLARAQLFIAGRECKDTSGLALEYRVVGRVPGHVLGSLKDRNKPALLYLHGGAFVLPAAPEQHVQMVGRMCRDLGAVGFVPDYRLAPANKFPAALDDCERAYRALLDLGFAPERIAIAGESAGGTLLLGVLQRLRKAGLPLPVCAVPISPGVELGRLHGPRSRSAKMRSDPILPISVLHRVSDYYIGNWDTSDPELSPLYADFQGFPPTYLLASENEVLLDDTLLLAQRLREAGIPLQLDVWPILPHAFPVLESLLPEARLAREDMTAFMRKHLA